MSIKNINTEGFSHSYDICIIGSGPAGMTLAAELSDSGKKICVLESGIEHTTKHNDDLREVKSPGEIKIKISSRERVLGGASTTWGGGSAPLDEADLSYRDFLTYPSNWPFGISELNPYYKRASAYGFPSFEKFNFNNLSQIKEDGDVNFSTIGLDEKIFIATDPPWNFGKQLKYIFEKPNMDLYINATVMDLSSELDGGDIKQVVSANVVSSDGAKWKIFAKKFVITAGGLESTRILLLSNNVTLSGLGNENDQVGRYLMNHPKNSFGLLTLNKPIKKLPYFFGYLYNGSAGYAGLRLSPEVQKSLKLLNSYIRFEPVFPWSDNSGVLALLTVVKKIKFIINFWKKNQKHIVHLRDYNETPDDINTNDGSKKFNWVAAILDIILNLKEVLNYSLHRLFPEMDLFITKIRLRNFMEMEPRPENRMILGEIFDINGKKQAVVNVNTSSLDRESLIVLHKKFKQEVERNKIGVFDGDLSKENPWPINFDASHHLGGTRMGQDPNTSVVNSDLRVHKVNNLYICSGSVFPTSGCANPTYTICALSIRLADNLKNQ